MEEKGHRLNRSYRRNHSEQRGDFTMESDKVKALLSDYLSSLNHLTSLATLSSASSAGEQGKNEAANTVFLGCHPQQGEGIWYLNTKVVSQPADLDRAGMERASPALRRRGIYFPTTDKIRFTHLLCVYYCASMK